MILRTRIHLPAVAAVTAALILPGCAGAPAQPGSTAAATATGDSAFAAYPVSITNCGVEVTLAEQPAAIVTLNQGATEVVLALGDEANMAGTAYLDDEVSGQWADAYASVPVLSQEYPTREEFVAVHADFAYASYASAFADDAVGTRQELAAEGTQSYISPFACPDEADRPAVTMEAVWNEIEEVGLLLGMPEAAAELRASQEADLAAVAAAAPAAQLTALWYDSGDDTPFVGAGSGGPQLILDSVGATNIFGDVPGNWVDGSWEEVVAADPDIIVLADASWSPAQDKIDYLESDPVLSGLSAVANGAYVTVSFSESTPGVRLVEGATKVADQVASLTE
ncbi:MAG: ABC transporter substrate-binding protein [Arachnia sp.]